ncbi:MAG: DUF1887 family protein [Victivallales bacterium]|nr:DUF1887 family protein [Victivallales bacterium]
MSHHLCLVSDQTMPNYLPIKAQEIKPSKVTLAVTDKMKTQGERLRQELSGHGIMVDILSLGADAASFDELQDIFLEWVSNHETEDIVLNVTGGTKPMAIAAQEVFRGFRKPVFYVDVDTDKVWWLDSSLDTPKWSVKCNITKPITTATYLALHGVTLESGQQAFKNPEWFEFAKELAEKASNRNFGNLLGQLNRLAKEAENRNSLDGGQGDVSSTEWMNLLESLWANEITRDKTRLLFRSNEARFFANGGWLEAYLFHYIKRIVPYNDTTYLNSILKGASGERNEIDVLTQTHNQLFVFECKTRNYSNENSAAEALYKLLAIGSPKNIGLRTNNIFVTYRDLNDADLKRADSYRIKIIRANELHPKHIESKLKAILEREL